MAKVSINYIANCKLSNDAIKNLEEFAQGKPFFPIENFPTQHPCGKIFAPPKVLSKNFHRPIEPKEGIFEQDERPEQIIRGA